MADKKIEVLDEENNKLKLVKQTHTKGGVIKLEYKGETNTAMVLLREDGTYDEFLYDSHGLMIKYLSKKLE